VVGEYGEHRSEITSSSDLVATHLAHTPSFPAIERGLRLVVIPVAVGHLRGGRGRKGLVRRT
jgi:hypothetical protein